MRGRLMLQAYMTGSRKAYLAPDSLTPDKHLKNADGKNNGSYSII